MRVPSTVPPVMSRVPVGVTTIAADMVPEVHDALPDTDSVPAPATDPARVTRPGSAVAASMVAVASSV